MEQNEFNKQQVSTIQQPQISQQPAIAPQHKRRTLVEREEQYRRDLRRVNLTAKHSSITVLL